MCLKNIFLKISCLVLVEIKVHKDLFVVLMEQGSHCDGKTFKKFKGYTRTRLLTNTRL
jgi:hypothetical protein